MARTAMTRAGCIALAFTFAGCGGGPASEGPGGPAPATAGTREAGTVRAGAMSADRSHYQSVVEMLRGKAPGLEIIEVESGRIEVRIRGLTQSLQPTNQEPLVVVDGMPSSRPAGEVLMTLNPRDVAGIDVLKDVSSTAVYGTRGANGVIIVTLIRDH
jgi:TonB-dependent SusC/RagA subfamily outer membrane receptor